MSELTELQEKQLQELEQAFQEGCIDKETYDDIRQSVLEEPE